MSISQNIEKLRSSLPEQVKLVCVSKYKPIEAIQEAYAIGQRVFGESKVQELTSKHEQLPKDIEWHFIGHLQSNKVKHLVPFVGLIHGVDSEKLLIEIDKQAQKINKTVNCLLQVHIAQERTKFGFSEKELLDFLNSTVFKSLKNVTVCGLMGMATYTDDAAIVKAEFKTLKDLFDKLKASTFSDKESFKDLSIGMSDDFRTAVEEGSTMVRIGSAIFGERVY